jgi:uncharacterized membrane protein (TIGR02234 family)
MTGQSGPRQAVARPARMIATAPQATAASHGALGGSTTGGTSPGGAAHAVVIAGSTGHAVISAAPWLAAVACGAVAIILAGLATAWRGPLWPVMSARFDRAGQQQRRAGTDSATMWESLSRDVDPTVEGQADPRNLEDQLGGGAPG